MTEGMVVMKPHEFGLGSANIAQTRWDLPTRLTMIGAGSLFAIGGVYLLAVPPSGLQLGSWGSLAFAFLIGVGVTTIALSFVAFRSRPTSIVIGPAGPVLKFASGRSRAISWLAPGTRIQLSDLREPARRVSGYLERRTGLMWVAPGPAFDLSPEAFDAIVGMARAAGLDIDDRVEDTSSLPGVKVIDISGHRKPV